MRWWGGGTNTLPGGDGINRHWYHSSGRVVGHRTTTYHPISNTAYDRPDLVTAYDTFFYTMYDY